MRSLVFKSSLMWLGFCALAFFNGALREIIFKPILGFVEPMANQVSCLTGVILWTTFALWGWSRLQVKSWSQALSIGFGWFLATFLFETLIIDHILNWEQILATYDFSAGQYWGLVLIWIGILPIILFSVFRIRQLVDSRHLRIFNHY